VKTLQEENVQTMKKFMLRRLGVANEHGSAKPSLQDCLEAVLGQSDTLIDDVLVGLKASLLPSIGKSTRVQMTAQGKLTIETLCTNVDALKQSFAVALRAAVYGGDKQRHSEQPLVRFEDFQFLDEEQIDANIELALARQEVLLAVDEVVPVLDGLMSNLLGWVTVQAQLNPLKPDSFVYALRESFLEHVPQDDIRASLMTSVSGLLGVSLRQLYKEISEWLRSQGVESVGPVSTVMNVSASANSTEANAVTRTMLTLDKLRRLLSGELNPAGMGSGAKDFMHTVPASFVALQDMQLVEPMMKRLTERAAVPPSSDAAGSAVPVDRFVLREQTKSKKLGLELGEEVVRLMLESLMQDHRLLASVRRNLKAMEPILIELSRTDPRFFSDRKHPARQFLDKVTNRSLAFTSEQEPGYARFLKVFDNALSVLSGGQGDAAAFARLLRKLEEGWAQEEQQQRQRAEEAARGLLHAEQRNLLAQRLMQDFSERLKDKTVPEIVVSFLRGPWAQVVAESQLQCVDGTVDADGFMGLVDDLIWSVQLRLARRNRARLVELVPGMLVKMRQGLGLISYPPERIPVFFDALISFHEKAFEGSRSAPPPAPAAVPVPVPTVEVTGSAPVSDGFWIADSEAADSGYLHDEKGLQPPDGEMPIEPQGAIWSVDSLNAGSWVDLALGGLWVRAQLTWASPHRTLFMFISGTGMAHSMSRRTLDKLSGKGLIRLVSDGRVMDNALDAVAQAALRNDLKISSDSSQF
jgi:hypothetical protein